MIALPSRRLFLAIRGNVFQYSQLTTHVGCELLNTLFLNVYIQLELTNILQAIGYATKPRFAIHPNGKMRTFLHKIL
jgi:hypothetical protein